MAKKPVVAASVKEASQKPSSSGKPALKNGKGVTSSGDDTRSGTPLGDCSPEEPANTLPAEPVSIARLKQPGRGRPSASSEVEDKVDETPALHGENDIPSDGRDPEGEAMMRKVPARKGDSGKGSSGSSGSSGNLRSGGSALAGRRTEDHPDRNAG